MVQKGGLRSTGKSIPSHTGASACLLADAFPNLCHEAHVDRKNKVVTTPAFMCETELHHIHDGIGAMVAKVLELARK